MPEAGTPSVVYQRLRAFRCSQVTAAALVFFHTSMVGALRLEVRPRG